MSDRKVRCRCSTAMANGPPLRKARSFLANMPVHPCVRYLFGGYLLVATRPCQKKLRGSILCFSIYPMPATASNNKPAAAK